ncbi:MAG: hypothetical protein MHM6MM_002313 [Cercozoa sp. M6MM]
MIYNDSEQTYTSAEQYMMAEKARLFGDYSMRRQILAVNNPRKQKALGRKVRDFDAQMWHEQGLDIVTQGNFLKFSQNEHLAQALLETGDKTIVEASPYDTIWGIGMHFDDPDAIDPSKWRGTNLLGQALMRVRSRLRSCSIDRAEVNENSD